MKIRTTPKSDQPTATFDAFDIFSDLDRWTGWKEIPRKKGFQKIPYRAPGEQALVNEPSTWLSRKQATRLAAAAHLDGIGILLGRYSPRYNLCGVDLDECRDPETGALEPWAKEIIERFNSYTEVSPSGTGVKIFFIILNTVCAALRRRKLLGKSGNRTQFKRAHQGGRHAPGIEFDVAARYYTTTGVHLDGTPDCIEIVSMPELDWVLLEAGPAYVASPAPVAGAQQESRGDAVLAEARNRSDAPKKLRKLLAGNFAHLKKDDSRSARDIALVGGLKRLGYSRDDAEAALLAFEYGAGHEYVGDPRYFDRMWANAYNLPVDVRSADLPTIRIEPGNIASTVDECEAALLAANAPIYCRGDILVQPSISAVEAAGGVTIVSHRVRPVSAAALLEELSRVARFERSVRDNEFRRIDCPPDVANKLLARSSWTLRPLLNVITAPTVRQDGSVLSDPGYDEVTKLLFESCGVTFGNVLSNPSRNDAKAAIAVLRELVSTFPFVAPEDLAVALSGIITALLRPTLRAAPAHTFSAPAAGTGKSLLVDVIAIIATGSPCPVQAQGATKEEADKRIGSALLAGDVIISIDNCSMPLGGDTLCQALTQDVVSTRILGKSKMVMAPAGSFICATGNNLRISGDLTRRALLAALDARVEHPELRRFPRDALQYAESQRSNCVVAALTIVRAYKLAGNPTFKGKQAPLGSFEQWSTTVRDAIMWAGGADPCETMKRARDSDPEREQITALITGWQEVVGKKAVTLKELCYRALADGKATETLKQSMLTIAGEAQAINPRRLAAYLARNQDRIIDGKCIVKVPGRAGVARWRLETHEE